MVRRNGDARSYIGLPEMHGLCSSTDGADLSSDRLSEHFCTTGQIGTGPTNPFTAGTTSSTLRQSIQMGILGLLQVTWRSSRVSGRKFRVVLYRHSEGSSVSDRGKISDAPGG